MPFETLTVAYDPFEDRILAAADLDKPQPQAFWLTRRMTLAFLRQAAGMVSKTSALEASANVADRFEVASIEREAALSATRGALSAPDTGRIEACKDAAERATGINLELHEGRYRLTFLGRDGRSAADLPRPFLQRILSLIAAEAAKGDWGAPEAPSVEAAPPPPRVAH